VRIKIDSWRCFAIIEEPRIVAQAVADALAEQWPDNEVAVHTRHDVNGPHQHRRAVEQSRLEWDPVVVAAFVDEARARRKKDPPAWVGTAARSARRGLQDLEVAVRADDRPARLVATAAGLTEEVVEQIQAGHGTLVISFDMESPHA
jgi:phytoene dehydrogenase-like protein